MVNHLKSKSCSGASGVDADQGDGQGFWNALRVEQAEALLAFIDYIQAQSGVQEVVVLGDLNAYGEEDPIDTLRDGGLADLLSEHVPEERRYSYVHEGEAGRLDNALATPTLAAKVTGATVWHINADEAEALDYRDGNLEGLFRPDPTVHRTTDPVVVGLALGDGGLLPMSTPSTTHSHKALKGRPCAPRAALGEVAWLRE